MNDKNIYDNLASFFIVTTPGLELLALQELQCKVPGLATPVVEKGGLTLECQFSLGLSLNHVLRIPTAILLRVTAFKCRDLPKLYKKISNIKWGQYLLNGEYELKAASSKSRLLNEKKIQTTVAEGIARHFEKQPPKKVKTNFSFEIRVRLFDDICTISLNTSGHLLFKRGYKVLAGAAPIRENLAAAMYFALHLAAPDMETLIDPMCGTGTLLMESFLFWKTTDFRSFAYENHPQWQRTNIERFNNQLLTKYVGVDKNEKALQQFRMNMKEIAQKEFSFPGELICQDFMRESLKIKNFRSVSFICNPPYNERLKLTVRPQQFYQEFLEIMLQYQPKAIGVIVPEKYKSTVSTNMSDYKVVNTLNFSNGGIPVEYRIYLRNKTSERPS